MPLTIGRHPDRVDLVVHAGDPIDLTVPVRDALGVLVDVTGWTATAVVLRHAGGQLLYAFTPALSAAGIRIEATGAETAAWPAAWPVHVAPLRISADHPSGEPIFRAAGWVHIYP